VAPQRDEIFKQKVDDYVQHIILQKFTPISTQFGYGISEYLQSEGGAVFSATPCVLRCSFSPNWPKYDLF